MEKIIILSDTHGNTADLIKLEQLFNEADHIVFAGDGINDFNYLNKDNYKKLIAVSGNCDQFFTQKEKIFTLGGKKILLTHGDLYRVKSTKLNLLYKAKEENVNIVIYGHTHSPIVEEIEGVLFINPGTLYKYGTKKTFAYLTIFEGKAVANINTTFFN